jgi:hypothetical protein
MEILYTGLIFLVIGFLIKMFPNLLAGYNHLSQKEKENAIANGLPTFAWIVFSIMGLMVISGHFMGMWIDKPSLGKSISLLVTLTGMVVLIVFGKRLTNNRV